MVLVPVFLALSGCSSERADPSHAFVAPTHTADSALLTDAHNVLLVLIDDVSAPKVGVYDESPHVRTPVLDALAADGVWFRNAWAAPSCSPTRAALQTGRHGRRTGYGSVQQTEDDPYQMGPDVLFLPELLASAPVRYQTAVYGKWHLGPAGGAWDQGWDTWEGPRANLVGHDELGPGNYYNWRKTHTDGSVTNETTYITTATTDDALAAARALPEPWLIHVSYTAAHEPFNVPPDALHTQEGLDMWSSDLDRQRAVLEAMDTELGRLLDGIAPEVRDRTTVLVIGDNGENADVREPGSGPGGKLSLLDGGVRVPFIAQGRAVPGRGPSDALVHVVDIAPTITALAGLEPTQVLDADGDPVLFDGHSLLPVFVNPEHRVRDVLYSELFEPNGPLRPPEEMTKDRRTVRDDHYKLVVDAVTGTELLFAYTDDHPEQIPVDLLSGPRTPDAVAAYERLRAELVAKHAAMAADRPYESAP